MSRMADLDAALQDYFTARYAKPWTGTADIARVIRLADNVVSCMLPRDEDWNRYFCEAVGVDMNGEAIK